MTSITRLWRRWRGLRRLWLLLAAALACQNVVLLHHSQGLQVSVMGLLVWAGALICLEDRLPQLRPQPSRRQLLLGVPLLLWVIVRSAQASDWDGLLLALAPVGGLALLLLGFPWRRWGLCREALLCLLLLPAYALVMRVVPEQPLSLASALGQVRCSALWGSLPLWSSAACCSRAVGSRCWRPATGSIRSPSCCVWPCCLSWRSPLRSWRSGLLVLTVTPLLAWLINALRVALLASFAGAGQGKGTFLFDFFHDQAGSLVFSGVGTLLLGVLYLRLIERQLARAKQS